MINHLRGEGKHAVVIRYVHISIYVKKYIRRKKKNLVVHRAMRKLCLSLLWVINRTFLLSLYFWKSSLFFLSVGRVNASSYRHVSKLMLDWFLSLFLL